MPTPQRKVRISDSEWDRWVSIAARSIPMDGTNAVTMYIRKLVNRFSDLVDRRAITMTESGLIVPTPRELLAVSTADERLIAELRKDIALNGLLLEYGPPTSTEQDWTTIKNIDEYIPTGPPT